MELTAKTLHEVTFGIKVRGYDAAEVDDFIAAVAEGVEELRERLRRAVERANRAEQAAASAQAAPVAAASQAGAAPSNTEISKVWERAVAAADQAIAEAQAEASRLLAEAQEQARTQTTQAREEAQALSSQAREQADAQTSQAQRNSEEMVAKATADAARISEESQAQLRQDIDALQAARDALKNDVDGLEAFLNGERDRLRSHLNDALGAIEKYSSDKNQAPGLSAVSVPAATVASQDFPAPPSPVEQPPTSSYSGASSASGDSGLDAPQYSSETVPEDTNSNFDQSEWSAPEPAEQETPESAAWDVPTEDEPRPEENEVASSEDKDVWGDDTPAHTQADREPGSDANVEGGDPFLAELRKAVQEDSPLGPREDRDNGLGNLYAPADDEEDKSGFFRRNKK